MMINNIKVVLVMLLALISISLSAQKKVWIKFGDESMLAGDAYSAAKFYEKALVYDTLDVQLQYKLAKAYMGYQNFPKALPICLSLKQKRGEKGLELLSYDLGRIYKYYAAYDTSKIYFTDFVQKGDQLLVEQDWAKNELNNLPKVVELLNDTSLVEVLHLPGDVNTGEAEFASVLINDTTLLYTSLKAFSLDEDGTVKDEDYNARFYQAVKEDSVWKVRSNISADGKKSLSIANGSFSIDKSKFYFTVCEPNGLCKIFEGDLKTDSLVNTAELPVSVNAEGKTSTHPHFVEILGRSFLFYSSNRIGGQGGMDLWVSEYKGSWKTPKNLGRLVNTKGDEISPFYDAANNELYFSSNWHYNLGGFDIFKSEGVFPNKWEEPVNIGIPFNSNLNDLYFSLKDSLSGFLTSSRIGSITEKGVPCCNDIYSFEKKSVVKAEVKDTVVLAAVRPTINDLLVKVYFHNDRPNKDSWDTTTALNYETTYARYTPLYETYKKEFSSQFKADKIKNAEMALDTFFINEVFKGYYDLVIFSDELLANLKEGNSVKVLLKGFASPLTKTAYNVNLSKRRIVSVINFLRAHKNGVLVPFIEGKSVNGAQLTFVKNPYGEEKAKEGVSDDYYDVKNSIYNPAAAMERKVELSAELLK